MDGVCRGVVFEATSANVLLYRTFFFSTSGSRRAAGGLITSAVFDSAGAIDMIDEESFSCYRIYFPLFTHLKPTPNNRNSSISGRTLRQTVRQVRSATICFTGKRLSWVRKTRPTRAEYSS